MDSSDMLNLVGDTFLDIHSMLAQLTLSWLSIPNNLCWNIRLLLVNKKIPHLQFELFFFLWLIRCGVNGLQGPIPWTQSGNPVCGCPLRAKFNTLLTIQGRAALRRGFSIIFGPWASRTPLHRPATLLCPDFGHFRSRVSSILLFFTSAKLGIW